MLNAHCSPLYSIQSTYQSYFEKYSREIVLTLVILCLFSCKNNIRNDLKQYYLIYSHLKNGLYTSTFCITYMKKYNTFLNADLVRKSLKCLESPWNVEQTRFGGTILCVFCRCLVNWSKSIPSRKIHLALLLYLLVSNSCSSHKIITEELAMLNEYEVLISHAPNTPMNQMRVR